MISGQNYGKMIYKVRDRAHFPCPTFCLDSPFQIAYNDTNKPEGEDIP